MKSNPKEACNHISSCFCVAIWLINPSYEEIDVTPPDTGGGDYDDNYNYNGLIFPLFCFSFCAASISTFLFFHFSFVRRVRLPAECMLKSLSLRKQAYNSKSAESILTKLYTGEFYEKLLLPLQSYEHVCFTLCEDLCAFLGTEVFQSSNAKNKRCRLTTHNPVLNLDCVKKKSFSFTILT